MRNVRVHVLKDFELAAMMLYDAMPVNGQVDIKDSQRRHIRRLKGLHFARASFCGPVSSQDLIVEVDHYLGNLKGPGDH